MGFWKQRVYEVCVCDDKSKKKKYMARVDASGGWRRSIFFGDIDKPHFEDTTSKRAWSHMDHKDPDKRREYFLAESGTPTKEEALKIEWKKSGNKLNEKILCHMFLN